MQLFYMIWTFVMVVFAAFSTAIVVSSFLPRVSLWKLTMVITILYLLCAAALIQADREQAEKIRAGREQATHRLGPNE